jgi:hypothetical protein
VRVRTATAAVLAGLAWAWTADAQGPGDATRRSPATVLVAMAEAWRLRDAEAYLRHWRFADEDARRREQEFLHENWDGEEAILALETPRTAADSSQRATAAAQVFTVQEPRGRLAQMLYTLERGSEGWAVVRREEVGDIDGLLHLSLGPQAFRAAGMTVTLEDFTMTWTRGALFTSPVEAGPTVLVFIGEGTVRFRPRLETERNQLRHYGGQPEIVETVRSAFVRIHPADFHRVVSPGKLEPDPAGAQHLAAAQRFYREQVEETFVLDSALPRSPWWLVPALGDGVVAFQGRRGVLTYALSRSDAEGIAVFDRRRRLQISLYPAEGGDTSYNEDDGQASDVLHHDLSVRFEPERWFLSGENTLHIRLLVPAPTVRLRLAESLKVESVKSADGREHPFFRVRHQDSVMVSLGPLAGQVGEIRLTVKFSGVHRPDPVEREVLQGSESPFDREPEGEIALEPLLVYSNRTAWYPQGAAGDYATAVLRFDVPLGQMAVTGGTLAPPRTQGGRTLLEYRQVRPGKYITAAVGRLTEVASPAPKLRGFSVPRARPQTAPLLADAAEMLAFFEGIFGPCPYPTLNVVVMEGSTPGGHSPPGMVVMSLRPPLLRNQLRDDPATFWDIPGFFLAHELAHQWWGQGVAGQNYHERWLSEAMAQYAAALWARHRLGDEMFRTVMERMARWAMRHSDQGPIHLGHRLGHLQGDPQIYRAVVYDKGAWVLHMLRERVGADAFARALTVVQREHRFGKAGSEHLRAALEKESGLQLGPYFREWVYGTALPELEVSRRTTPGASGSFATAVTITPRNLPGPMPLEVAVVHARGREGIQVMLPPEGGTFTVETKAPPRRVEVDARGALLARVVNVR